MNKMCECCGADCKLCIGALSDSLKMDGYMTDEQPLNEAYQNEILEAYQKISDTFDDFTQLMRRRVPYNSWPEHCKIAGLNEDLMGCAPKGSEVKFDHPQPSIGIPDFSEQLSNHSNECAKQFEECIRDGWKHVQPHCRPDESFRSMLRIMIKWMAYLESKDKYPEPPPTSFQQDIISRIEDIGRAQEKLKVILDDEMFDHLSKHDPYWDSNYELEADKLDDLRRKFSCLSDNLWDLWSILRKEEQE